MYTESDYYPPGAYNDPDAPWNQRDNEAIPVDVDVLMSLSKKDKVWTDQYDIYPDEDDCPCTEYCVQDWTAEWRKDHYTIPQMLEKLKGYLEAEIAEIKKDRKPGNFARKSRISELQDMLDDCQGWTLDEIDIDYE